VPKSFNIDIQEVITKVDETVAYKFIYGKAKVFLKNALASKESLTFELVTISNTLKFRMCILTCLTWSLNLP